VSGARPETLDFHGSSEPLRDVWVAVRAALRSVLERVSVADVASGNLPDHVKELLATEDAWVSR
jgi:DNA-binding IscR family transcriptional regulator